MGLSGCGGAQCRHHGERFAPRIKSEFSPVGTTLDANSCTSAITAGDFVKSEETAWQATLEINLRAVLVGAHVATHIMRQQRSEAKAKGVSAATHISRRPWLHACLRPQQMQLYPVRGQSTAAAELYLEQGACTAPSSYTCL